jgi:regulator of sigma E protease
MQLLETLFYFVVTLGVLVFVHELGHFLAAKMCGMRVDRFSIGFPPRAFGKTIGDTDYCVSWIPLGGYVKIAGMIDESFDTEHLDRPVEPWEFRAKPIWQRSIVLSAGVTMNLILAVLIFWAINYHQGRIVRETTEISYVQEESPAAKGGIRAGDKIVRINDRAVTNWDQILSEVYIETAGSDVLLTVLRDGKETQLIIPRNTIPDPGQAPLGIVPPYTKVLVTTVEPGKPASTLGLKPGDTLVSLAGTPLRYDEKVREIVRAHAGRELAVEWERGDSLRRGTLFPTDEGKIGISYSAAYTGPVTRTQYSLLQALPQGVKDTYRASGLFIQQIAQLITGKSSFSQSVGGPIRIAQLATQTAELGFLTYLGFMALLSISLAILNILPFPVLDGGHLVFLFYEGIFRREIPVKVKLGIQKAGLVILLAFMAFVLYNDILHF